jgi:hypothetical protein
MLIQDPVTGYQFEVEITKPGHSAERVEIPFEWSIDPTPRMFDED